MAKAAIWTRCAEDRNQIGVLLASAGFEVAATGDGGLKTAADLLSLDLAIVEWDGKAPDEGLRLARDLRGSSAARLIILALNGSEDLAVEALRLRADDYIKVPYEPAELQRAFLHGSGATRRKPAPSDGIAGESESIRGVCRYIEQIAGTDSNVLITGETGTGKEVVAQAIHRQSRRRPPHPFICVNCAAIPDALLESELFGYERGAFTGAAVAREGKLKQAHRGTVFFDEIGDMSLAAQTKILRAIESREIYPLGGARGIEIDVRVIAATNRDLSAMMRDERFRSDLYFRLNVGRIHLPPLRERISDIPQIAESFLPYFNRVFGRRVEGLEDSVLREMMNYSWPGNIRELRNVIEIMFVHLRPGAVTLSTLPDQVANAWSGEGAATPDERERVISALTATEWNISKAARKLHWSRMTLYRKLAKYDMVRTRNVTHEHKKATA